MSKTIRLGPFDQILINDIKNTLSKHNISYSTHFEHLSSKHIKAEHIDVDAHSFTLVKKYLFDLGVSIDSGERQQLDQLLIDNERFCSQCDFSSTQTNVCPRHGSEMVDYYKFVQLKKRRVNNQPSRKFLRYSFFAFILFVVTVIAKKGFH